MASVTAFLILTAALSPVSYASSKQGIQIKGSDTMVNLVQAWAEEFMKQHPEALLAVTGGGSGTGIAALAGGTCDLAISSRPIKPKELEEAKKHSVEPREYTVAMDGLAVVVSTENPLSSLTVGQVRDIFAGSVTRWTEVGGDDRPIVLLSREFNSGTHVYFKEHVIRGGDSKSKMEFAAEALLLPSSQAIADEIVQNPNAIGYYGIGYSGKGQKILALAIDGSSEPIPPTIKNIANGVYPVSRPLFIYTNGEPSGRVGDFLKFILSPEGQKIVERMDFVPISFQESAP